MLLVEAPLHQRVKTSAGNQAVVLAHGLTGVLVLAYHHVVRHHDGKTVNVTERRTETWSNSTVCELLGQLVLDL